MSGSFTWGYAWFLALFHVNIISECIHYCGYIVWHFALQRMSENEYSFENDAVPSTGGKKKRKTGGKNQRWTEPARIFLIEFMVGLLRDRVKGDLNVIAANEIKNKFDMAVSDKHVYNQLRTWKSKWSQICTLKTLGGCVVWKPKIRTIEMLEAVQQNISR